jgi:Fur family ferric uptake transcriptional regulator
MGIIRRTPSIDAVMHEFQKDSEAIAATELIKRLDNQLNKTTIYRLLEKLEDDGVLHSFLDKSGIKWYAQCNDCSKTKHVHNHPHFQCLDCGKLDCVSIKVEIPKITNRKIETSQVLLLGKCESCLN